MANALQINNFEIYCDNISSISDIIEDNNTYEKLYYFVVNCGGVIVKSDLYALYEDAVNDRNFVLGCVI